MITLTSPQISKISAYLLSKPMISLSVTLHQKISQYRTIVAHIIQRNRLSRINLRIIIIHNTEINYVLLKVKINKIPNQTIFKTPQSLILEIIFPYSLNFNLMQQPSPTQQSDPQQYLPPNTYSTAKPQGFSFDPSQNGLSKELQVKHIDHQLSTGWYSCYNCWLYVMAISSILTLVNIIWSTSHSFFSVYYGVELLFLLNYSVVMIGALKNKTLKQANMGHKIALIFLGFLLLDVVIESYRVFNLYTIKFVLIYFGGLLPVVGLYYFFVIFNSARKIKELLEKREGYLQKSSSSYEDSVSIC